MAIAMYSLSSQTERGFSEARRIYALGRLEIKCAGKPEQHNLMYNQKLRQADKGIANEQKKRKAEEEKENS
jgi:hypothetical protein